MGRLMGVCYHIYEPIECSVTDGFYPINNRYVYISHNTGKKNQETKEQHRTKSVVYRGTTKKKHT